MKRTHRFFQRPAKQDRPCGHLRKLRLEPLERRAMLTTFFVDGSAGDGGTGAPNDPFDTIQEAIDAAELSPGPDSVNIRPGVYEENLTIEDPDKLKINGNGATVTSALGDDEHTIEIDDSSDVTIKDLKVVDGDDGIRADDVGSLTLINVEATGNDDEGVQANDIGKVRVVGANLSDNGGDGLAVEDAAMVQIVGGTFSNNDDGIDLEVVGSSHINRATADGNDDEGLEVDDSGEIKVVGGTYTNNADAGLDIDDTVEIRIVGVVATGNGNHGLQIELEDDADEDDITVIESVSIVNSVFSNNVGDGIQITEEDDTTVEQVSITNVVVANNEEDGNGNFGRGLFIDISGDLRLKNVTSEGNDNPDVLP